ncbi:hypothetical protein HK405_002982, partial [Cladochytrium tenue]
SVVDDQKVYSPQLSPPARDDIGRLTVVATDKPLLGLRGTVGKGHWSLLGTAETVTAAVRDASLAAFLLFAAWRASSDAASFVVAHVSLDPLWAGHALVAFAV